MKGTNPVARACHARLKRNRNGSYVIDFAKPTDKQFFDALETDDISIMILLTGAK